MDEADLIRFYRLFTEQLRRDPTDVELFQLAQGNSEHCRHGFFTGHMIIDGEVQAGQPDVDRQGTLASQSRQLTDRLRRRQLRDPGPGRSRRSPQPSLAARRR